MTGGLFVVLISGQLQPVETGHIITFNASALQIAHADTILGFNMVLLGCLFIPEHGFGNIGVQTCTSFIGCSGLKLGNSITLIGG